MPRPRYFWSRQKSGKYHVKDRQLHDMVVAECFYREAAALVQTALNKSVEKETPSVITTVKFPEPPDRTAIFGDLYPEPTTWVRDSTHFPEFFDIQPDGRAIPSPRR